MALRGGQSPGAVTYTLLMRHFERLLLANFAAVLACLSVVGAPVGLAGMLGVVEAAWRKPSRKPGWREFSAGVRRYWKPMLVQWAVTLAVLAALPVSVLFYGKALSGKAAFLAAAVEGVFAVLLWMLWVFALGSAVAERARREGRAGGKVVGLVEGFSEHFGAALAGWLIHLAMVVSVAGLAAFGLVLPALYVLSATAGVPDVLE